MIGSDASEGSQLNADQSLTIFWGSWLSSEERNFYHHLTRFPLVPCISGNTRHDRGTFIRDPSSVSLQATGRCAYSGKSGPVKKDSVPSRIAPRDSLARSDPLETFIGRRTKIDLFAQTAMSQLEGEYMLIRSSLYSQCIISLVVDHG